MGCKYVLTCIYMLPTCKRLNLIYCINFGLQRNPPEEPVDTAKLNSISWPQWGQTSPGHSCIGVQVGLQEASLIGFTGLGTHPWSCIFQGRELIRFQQSMWHHSSGLVDSARQWSWIESWRVNYCLINKLFPGEQTVCQDKLFCRNFLQQTVKWFIGLKS